MARQIHVDMVGGLAGDMFLAAALDAGMVEVGELEEAFGKVGFGPITVQVEEVVRGSIRGRWVKFGGWGEEQEKDHRHLSEIKEMLEGSGLSARVRAHAVGLFMLLGEAESKMHMIPIETVHFHEVGAIDSILDFVGAAVVIAKHEGAVWTCGGVPMGQGMIETSHGTMPALAPAAATLLEGFEMRGLSLRGECVTPTGAAILKYVGAEQGRLPSGKMVSNGWGAGTKEWEEVANVVRMTLYEAGGGRGWLRDEVVQLSFETDDQSPEEQAHVAGRLMEEGARDVVRSAVVMKKGRMGVGWRVLVEEGAREEVLEALFLETSTFGVRVERVGRVVLEREMRQVETEYGAVVVKVGMRGGEVVKMAPEYESCAKAASAHGVALRQVYEAVRVAWGMGKSGGES